MSFKSIWGMQSWLRVIINIFMWGPMSIIWALTLIGLPELYSFFGMMMNGVMWVWFARSMILIIWQSVALIGDKYEDVYETYDYFETTNSFGSELGIGSEYNGLDLQLEAFSLLA